MKAVCGEDFCEKCGDCAECYFGYYYEGYGWLCENCARTDDDE